MDIAREDLVALVDQTWQTLFGDSACESDASGASAWEIRSDIVIRGAWNGLVTVLLPASTAEQIACRMLDAKPGEISADEIRDAAGEMVNILGGSLKSILPQPSSLGLPEVSNHDSRETDRFGAGDSHNVNFVWGDTQFSVIIRTSAELNEG